jgi:hypothetical protein
MRMFAQMTVIALVLLSVFCVSTTPVSAAITSWAPAPAPSRPSWTTKAYSPGPAPAASAPTTHLPGSRRGHVAAPVPAPGPAPPGYYAPAPAPVGAISAAAASASSLPSFTTAAISLISALVFIAAAASS